MVTSKSAAPSADDVAEITAQIYGKDSQVSLDAAYTLTTTLLNSVGFRGLTQYGLLQEIIKAATNKKDASKRQGSMYALGAIFERLAPPPAADPPPADAVADA